jgi:hypothetical protein
MENFDYLTKEQKIKLIIEIAPLLIDYIKKNPNDKYVNDFLSEILLIPAFKTFVNGTLELFNLLEEEENPPL